VERVTGIGGVFFRAKDPEALRAWYAEHLGVVDPPGGVWRQEEGPTVFAPFSADTNYFGRPEQAFMVNFRVRDLGAMLAQLRAAGAEVEEQVVDEDGVGRFGWAIDPEGNRIELWEPSSATR
jgi:catechol 2,3-dioxygenase-like lactoylglutathione lyase family enzyme